MVHRAVFSSFDGSETACMIHRTAGERSTVQRRRRMHVNVCHCTASKCVCWCGRSLYQLFKMTNGHRPPGGLANYKQAYCGAKQGQFLPQALHLMPLAQCDKLGPKTESLPQVELLPKVVQYNQQMSKHCMGAAHINKRALFLSYHTS